MVIGIRKVFLLNIYLVLFVGDDQMFAFQKFFRLFELYSFFGFVIAPV